MSKYKYIEKCINQFSEFTNKESPYTRHVFSADFKAARTWLCNELKLLGCEVARDYAGNLKGILKTSEDSAKRVLIGSHLDTVFNGGRYDGIAGVVAGLSIIKSFEEDGINLPFDLEIYDYLGEELNEWNTSCVGTRGLTGQLTEEMLSRTNGDGEKLIDKIIEEGGEAKHLFEGLIRLDNIIGSFELHIEQGSILQNSKTKIGIVNSIPTISRHKISIIGQAGHTGTTSMADRKDALVSGAALIEFINTCAKEMSCKSNRHFVATVGKIDVFPNAVTIIPSSVEMLLDLRVVDSNLRKQFLQLLGKECLSRENKDGVSIDIQQVAFSKYVEMDKQLNSLIQHCAKIRGLSAIHMDSGAGHDTAHLAKFIPASLIFIPCLDGHSHCPEEFAEIDDIVNGANIIETAILKMASQPEFNVNEG